MRWARVREAQTAVTPSTSNIPNHTFWKTHRRKVQPPAAPSPEKAGDPSGAHQRQRLQTRASLHSFSSAFLRVVKGSLCPITRVAPQREEGGGFLPAAPQQHSKPNTLSRAALVVPASSSLSPAKIQQAAPDHLS